MRATSGFADLQPTNKPTKKERKTIVDARRPTFKHCLSIDSHQLSIINVILAIYDYFDAFKTVDIYIHSEAEPFQGFSWSDEIDLIGLVAFLFYWFDRNGAPVSFIINALLIDS